MQSYLNNTPQSLGLLFEDEVHELLVQTKLPVLREKDIVKKYGQNVKGIDHLLFHQDYIICIQDKRTSSSPVLSVVNHFIQCVESISWKENKKCIGIYLTKQGLTGPARTAISDTNSRNKNQFIELHDDNLSRLKYKLLDLFYSNHIYIYEYDDSLYMLPARFEGFT